MFSSSPKIFTLLLTSFMTTLVPTIALAEEGTTTASAKCCTEMAQGHNMMKQGSGMNHSMSLGPADTEYDLRFIDGMMLHHQGAIEMAQFALTKSQRKEIKQLAQEIITAQKKEIAQMKKWRQAWYPKAGNAPIAWNAEMNHSMGMTAEQKQSMMMSMDLGKADTNFDLRFLNGMIPHHQGAVEMAQDALSKSKRSEIKQLAQEIVATQQPEINQMKKWRKAWYGK